MQCMMKILPVELHKLEPKDFTKDFCSQNGISRHSAGDCKEMLQLWCNVPESEIVSHTNVHVVSGQHNNLPNIFFVLWSSLYVLWIWGIGIFGLSFYGSCSIYIFPHLLCFACLVSFLLFPSMSVVTTLVHEFDIFCSHTEWNLFFSLLLD